MSNKSHEEKLDDVIAHLYKEIADAEYEARRADCHGDTHDYERWSAVAASLVRILEDCEASVDI